MKLEDDMGIVQWMFDTEFMMNTFAGPIDAKEMCDRIRLLHSASSREPGSPESVLAAWTYLSETLGPRMTGQFISCGTWRDVCPAPADTSLDADDVATLWCQDGKRVVARVQYDGKKPVGVSFSLE